MTRMRALRLAIALTGPLVLLGPLVARAQNDRDFVFDDEEGYRILRFAGVGPGPLTEDQLYEVSNAEFSSMVHDRIYADVVFDTEPMDREWSESTEPAIRRHLIHALPHFESTTVECRSASCRIVLEHSGSWTIPSHQKLLEDAQLVIEGLIEAQAPAFQDQFLITAYWQQFEDPHIKVFLKRTPETR